MKNNPIVWIAAAWLLAILLSACTEQEKEPETPESEAITGVPQTSDTAAATASTSEADSSPPHPAIDTTAPVVLFRTPDTLMRHLLVITWTGDTAAYRQTLPSLDDLDQALANSSLNEAQQIQRLASYRSSYDIFVQQALQGFEQAHRQLRQVYADESTPPQPTDTAAYSLGMNQGLHYALRVTLPLTPPEPNLPPLELVLPRSLQTQRGYFGGQLKLRSSLGG